MRFTVAHETLYRYARPVRLAPHRLRLTPRPGGAALRAHELVVEPTPSARREEADAFGNLVTHLEFDGATEVFRILSRFELETSAAAPAGDQDLAPYLVEPHPDDSVHAFAAALAEGASPAAFLEKLTRTLFSDFHRHIRDNGAARTPAQTLALGQGACRDLTVLFLAACRSQGIPARFVSGYQARAESPDGKRHLHAWAEAHLPGLGWRGYDPTHGLAVEDGHVALCAAPDQARTMPVEGGYWGEAVACDLSYEVSIDAG